MKNKLKPKSRALTPRGSRPIARTTDRLLADVRGLIEAARQHVAQAVNSTLVTLYWHVGRCVRQEILGEQRAEYGQQIVAAPRRQLTAEYGRGSSEPNLSRMMRPAEAFPNEVILSTPSKYLTAEHGWGSTAKPHFTQPGSKTHFRTNRLSPQCVDNYRYSPSP